MNLIDKVLIFRNVVKEVYQQRQRFIALAYDSGLGYNLLNSNENLMKNLKKILIDEELEAQAGNIYYYNQDKKLEEQEVVVYPIKEQDLILFYVALNLENGDLSFLGPWQQLLEKIEYQGKTYKSDLKHDCYMGIDIEAKKR